MTHPPESPSTGGQANPAAAARSSRPDEAGVRTVELVYRPRVDLACNRITAAQARLREPVAATAGPVAAGGPDAATALAWDRIRAACRQAAAWHGQGLPLVRIGVALPTAFLEQADLPDRIQAVLVQTGATPAMLGLEFDAGALPLDAPRVTRALAELRATSVEIALGCDTEGPIDLDALRSLPIDRVTIDCACFDDLALDSAVAPLRRAFLDVAREAGWFLLADGVAHEGDVARLAEHGCDAVQGDGFSPPVSADAFAALLSEGRSLPERRGARLPGQRTLLLVDDETHVLAALRRAMRHDGYRIVTALGAEAALQVLAEQDVDVIVSDQRMPGMTGVDLLRRTKALYPDTVRMVLSGYTELQSILDAVNEGAVYRFMTKPWDDDQLRVQIAEAFAHKGLIEENRRLTQQVAHANTELAATNQRLEQVIAQRDAQAALLAASAGGLRAVLEQLPVPVIGFDVDGAMSFLNRAAAEVMPEAGLMLGQPMPAELQAPAAGTAGTLVLDGVAYLARSGALEHEQRRGGRVMVLMPPLQDATAP